MVLSRIADDIVVFKYIIGSYHAFCARDMRVRLTAGGLHWESVEKCIYKQAYFIAVTYSLQHTYSLPCNSIKRFHLWQQIFPKTQKEINRVLISASHIHDSDPDILKNAEYVFSAQGDKHDWAPPRLIFTRCYVPALLYISCREN